MFHKKNPNPHIKYTDLDRHGYYILDVTKAQTQADFYYMEDILTKNEKEYFGTAWFTKSGKSHLEQGNQSLTKPNASALAPITIDSITTNWLITGIHPKLEKHQVFVQCIIQTDKPVLVELHNSNHQKIRTLLQKPQPKGIFTFSFNTSTYPKGQYQIVVKESRYFFELEK